MAKMEGYLFVSCVSSTENWHEISCLVASLRQFGGMLGDSPMLIYHPADQVTPSGWSLEGVECKIINVPPVIHGYWFSWKVTAMAQAEMDFKGQHHTLIWIDPACLILNPPDLYLLDETSQAAFRPVHIQNVGLRMDQPLDEYWRRVYKAVGLQDTDTTVESYVDGQRLRAYYNTHAFSIDPRFGLMGRWLEVFSGLVTDADFQNGCCADERHRIFLFQAVLSALMSKELPTGRIRILPATYNYPYNLQSQVPLGQRVSSFAELVSLTYEGRSLDPVVISDIAIPEPYRSFFKGITGQ